MAIEIIQNEDGSVSFKRGDTILTDAQIEQALDREKNLEAGYQKKFQEVAAMRKQLEDEAGLIRTWNKALEENPELEAEINAVIEKSKKKSISNGNEQMTSSELKALKAELEALKHEREQEKQKMRFAEIKTFWNNKLKEITSELKIDDEENVDTLRRVMFSEVAASGEDRDPSEIVEFVKKKALRFTKDPALAKAGKDVHPPVNTKGGGGGRTQTPEKKPAPHEPNFRDAVSSFAKQLLNKT